MISLCIIAKDNERDIERLLSRVANYFSEVIVVDTGSKDKTAEVAKKFGAKVFVETNHLTNGVFDFSKARNSSLDKATSEWIFWLDTDDDVSGLENLQELTKKDVDGYAFKYNYARDTDGNILAVQWRERLFKKDVFEWKGQLHETAIQKRSATIVKDDSIVVEHLATIEKMQASNKRNIEILEAEVKADKKKVDPRTLYYLAQAYRGVNEFMSASKYYVEYLKVGGWDEEKMFAWHYLADCMRFLGKFDEAIIADMEAIKLMPELPDGYFGLGYTYFYMADKVDEKYWRTCLEWIRVGFSKKMPDLVRVIEPQRYTWMPLLQMAIAQLNIGEVREAYQNFKRALKMSNGSDFVAEHAELFEEIYENDLAVDGLTDYMAYLAKNDKAKLKNIEGVISDKIGDNPKLLSLKNRVTAPKTWGEKSVVIYCAFSYEAWAYPSIAKGIGGSEEAVINMGIELTKLGYDVTVFNSCKELRGDYGGVKYRNIWEMNPNDKFNIFISWRNPFSFKTIKAKQKWVWLHDVPDKATYTKELVETFDKIVVLSKFHKSLIPSVPAEKILVSSNGIVPEHFGEAEKKPNSLFYGSSYDRGLFTLLDKIYPLVQKEIPEVTLDVCYGWDTFLKMNGDNPEAMAWKADVDKLLEQKGITHHGRVSHKKVAKLMSEAMVHAYPTEFEEINCHPAGTRIMTDSGEIEIEKLSFSDTVLTHAGNMKPIKTLMRKKAEKLLKFTVQSGDDLICTPEHPIYVLRDGKPQFVEAKEIRRPTQWKNRGFKSSGDFLIFPKIRLGEGNLSLDATYNGRKNNFPTVDNYFPDTVEVTPNLAWFMGYFAGDGNATLRTGKVSVLVADKHPEHLDMVLAGFGELGLTPSSKKLRGCTEYYVSSYKLARFFIKYFYDNKKKKIPIELLAFPETLDGLLSADGHNNGYNCTFTNTSLHLIGFARMALSLRGLSGKTVERKHNNGNVSYSMSWTNTDGNGFYKDEDDWILHKIKKIEEVSHNDWVYNIEVEDDNSFVANGHAVHNCITVQKAQCAGCFPITTNVAALKETNKYGVKINTDSIYSNEAKQKEFAEAIVKQLKNPQKIDTEKAIADFKWENVAEQWSKEWSKERSKERSKEWDDKN